MKNTSISDMTKKITKKDYWLEYQIPLLRNTGNNSDINNESCC